MLGDGSGWGGRSPQFYQKHEDDLVWMQTLLALIDHVIAEGFAAESLKGLYQVVTLEEALELLGQK